MYIALHILPLRNMKIAEETVYVQKERSAVTSAFV